MPRVGFTVGYVSPTVCIEIAYNPLLTYKEIKSLKSQITFTYGVVRRAERPLRLVLAGYTDAVLAALAIDGWQTWKIDRQVKLVSELYPKEQIVYLSPESPNVLETLDENKARSACLFEVVGA